MFLQSQFEELVEFASSDALTPELMEAQVAYFNALGSQCPQDELTSLRMAGFTEFYVFDWKLKTSGLTPAQAFLAKGQFRNHGDMPAFLGFTQTIHSVFQVRKVTSDTLRLRNLLTDETDIEIFDRRHIAGVEKGDIINARVIPMDSTNVLTPATFYHPASVRNAILDELKVRKKSQGDAFDGQNFQILLLQLWEKTNRYSGVEPIRIYDFRRIAESTPSIEKK